MDQLQWYDYLRMFNAILALFTFYRVAKRARRDWPTYTQRLREFSWVLQAFLLITFIGTTEQIMQNVPWGWRSVLTLIVVCAAFRASLRPEALIKEKP